VSEDLLFILILLLFFG